MTNSTLEQARRPVDDAVADEARPVRRLGAAYLTIARFAGDGDRLFDTYREHADVMSGVGRDHGLLLHAVAKTDDGLLVVNLWPSQAGSESAAADQRRLGVIEKAGIVPGQVQYEHHQVENVEVFS